MRVEVYYPQADLDGRAYRALEVLRRSGVEEITSVQLVDVYLIQGIPALGPEETAAAFRDPVVQAFSIDTPVAETRPDWKLLVEVAARPGVTDPVALTAGEAVETEIGSPVPHDAVVQTATQYLFAGGDGIAAQAETIAGVLHNPLIQRATVIPRARWDAGARCPAAYPHQVPPSAVEVQSIPLAGASDNELEALSKQRLLALSLAEMQAIRDYFGKEETRSLRRRFGLPQEATDVELEMIAQTWSEHCKHKIFQAVVDYQDETGREEIKSLFATYIRGATDRVAQRRSFLKSVFHDNSGVVQFHEGALLCFKVETHNSPSALDPYGGAITGIVGVNRDIIGTGKGAKPIFNTNVLCFGYPDTPEDELPPGLLHPRRVLAGVHHGIVDGGNQSGIPVVAGAFLFDDSFLGKPLVFCGTGGILPEAIHGEEAWVKHVRPNYKAVMVGGRIGKDGIHGATFSSQALDETSPTSAVQIGDPITQKNMLDFLLEARDDGLFQGITDNGAGGLSSSLGEMAEESGGVRIQLERCPLKYEGLAPWEILLSESQERMSVAVAPENLPAFLLLARRRDVEATVVGEFTDSGMVEVLHEGRYVGLLSLSFLHHGLPTMRLPARWSPPARPEPPVLSDRSLRADLLSLLQDPNIASKEALVRQYDHEVQGGSVVKPFVGPESDGPSDGAVVRLRPEHTQGITVTHGVCPRYGDVDTYHMAMCAVDEAFRAHVALGGDPERAAALDNFCWPDPIESADNPDGAYKMAQLVRACRGLHDACVAYDLPLISGKDSMKNDARIGGKKVSVRPTLLVSLMGSIQDVRAAVTSDFKAPGQAVYLVGETRGELGGSSFERLVGVPLGACPTVCPEAALAGFYAVHTAIRAGFVTACHDLADGGLGVALAESVLAGRVGARVTLPALQAPKEPWAALYSETPSRLLVTVAEEHAGAFEEIAADASYTRIGSTVAEEILEIAAADGTSFVLALDELVAAFRGAL